MHPENQLCAFLNYSNVDAWRVIEIPGHGEFLLVFQTLAIYVDLQGRKSRDREIMYPAVPTHISVYHILLKFDLEYSLIFFFVFLISSISAYCDGHLLVFSETHLDIFNTQTADWVQSIGLKRSRPLSNHGNVALTYINDSPLVIYLANMHTSECCHIFDLTSMKQYFKRLMQIFDFLGELINTHGEREGRVKPKRRFSLRETNNRQNPRT